MNKNSLIYYFGRILQRFSLCFVVGSTIIHWVILISISANMNFISNLENTKFKDSQLLNEEIRRVLDTQSMIVLRWLIISGVITAALLLIKRYKKYEKSMIIDSGVILVFCLLSIVFSQMVVRSFVTSFAL